MHPDPEFPGDLSDLERRLASWQPASAGLNADAMLFAAGQAAARLLTELPLEQREVVVARIWGGLTFEDVARLVGCSLPTAHRRYQAGLAALREKLERQWTPRTQRTT